MCEDYVLAMWMMLQAGEPDDYVIGTGESHSVREFCDVVFGLIGLEADPFIRIDEAYFRPTEVDSLQADPSKAREKFGWNPETTFEELAELMLSHDLANADQPLRTCR